MQYILVTGGLGYIGSHVVLQLLNKNYNVVIIDNLHNSHLSVFSKILSHQDTTADCQFIEMDICDEVALHNCFTTYDISSVIHFAALKSVPESIEHPDRYYKVNYMGSKLLLDMCIKFGVSKFIFSSSATVYGGECPANGYTEDMRINANEATHMYGKSKIMVEELLENVTDMTCVALRYFNPVGNISDGELGEDIYGHATNLLPIIGKVYSGLLDKLNVFGTDYNTIDGSACRDYIHVEDLADGHIKALNWDKPGFVAFNLGTGSAVSVLQMIRAFEEISYTTITKELVDRRDGDLAVSYANCDKAFTELRWHSKRTLDDSCIDFITRCLNQMGSNN